MGSVAFGLVLGWWAVLVAGGRSTVRRSALLVGVLIVAVTGAVVLGGPSGGALAVGGVLTGAALHLGFLGYLTLQRHRRGVR